MSSASSSVASRYARALIDLAKERRSLPRVRGEIDRLAELLAESPAFAEFVGDPSIDDDQRAAVFAKVCGGADKSLRDFLGLLVAKQRVDALPDICQAFVDLHDKEQGVLRAEVTSAAELSQSQLDRLCAKLAEREGREVHLLAAVDPSLVGGFRIRMGDQITDHSVAYKLKQFRQRVLNA